MANSTESTTDLVAPAEPPTEGRDESASVDADFVRQRVVQSFPRLETIKLDEGNYVQWQQHVQLIVDGYELSGYFDRSLSVLTRFVPNATGVLVLNLEFSLFQQQDKLLAAWLLSTISRSLLSCFIGVKTANDFWCTANRLFAAVIGAKISYIKHDLHTIKKGNLTTKEYVSKIRNTCALIEASGHQIQESEIVEVVLAGLSPEFDVVLTLASWSSEPLSLRKLIDILLEFESHQQKVVVENDFQANLVDASPDLRAAGADRSARGGCALVGRGRTGRGRS